MLAALACFVPLIGAAIMAGLSGTAKRIVADVFTLAVCAATIGLSAALFAQTRTHRVIHWFSGWTPRHGVAIGVSFTVDEIGAALAVFIAALAFLALVFSWRYLDAGDRHFHVLMLLFDGAMIGFALSGDLFILFVFFELMSVAAYALTALHINERGPIEGAVNFAVLNTLGSFALLLGVGVVYARTGALNFAQAGQTLARFHGSPVIPLAIALLFAGLLVKAAVVPFHFWLADAHAVAPTPVCVLFSGIMVELAIYGVARVYWTVFRPAVGDAQHALGLVLVGAGVASVIVGGVMAFSQQHIKRMLAFSTISHAGIAVAGVGAMSSRGIAGAAVYIAGHGMVKGALFVLAGIVLHRTGSLDEEFLRGRVSEPLVGFLFALGGLALAGLPPFGTDTGKTLIEEALGKPWIPWVFGIGSALTGGAVFRAALRMWLRLGPSERDRFSSERYAEGEEGRETTSDFDRLPPALIAPAIVLLVGSFVIGVWPHIAEHAQILAGRFTDVRAYTSAVLTSRDRLVTIVPQPSSIRGALYGVGAAFAAVMLAIVALFRRQVSEGARAPFRPIADVNIALRKLHTGLIGDYVVWFMAGLALFAGALTIVLR
jgi:multicomponent Na+:H+ antiporter subunit D